MITVFIFDRIFSLPDKTFIGSILSTSDAEVLNYIQHTRVKAELRRRLNKGDLAQSSIQDKALELMEKELKPYSTFDEDTDSYSKPILSESISIARELILRQIALGNLLPPPDIEARAREIALFPPIRERARLRVEARHRAAQAVLERMI